MAKNERNFATMNLTFWGAARQVTGSMHMLDLPSGTRVLIDCGLDYEHRDDFEEKNGNFPFSPESVDLMILTHAHIDHSGNVPNLIRQGFDGPIFCTQPTLELSDFLLHDSLNIQRMEAARKMRQEFKHKGRKFHKKSKMREPQTLYNKKHILDMLDQCILLDYRQPYEFNEELTIEFEMAGHILGAASARLSVTHEGITKHIGFTGDLGNYQSKLVVDPVPMKSLDYLITESTYGGRAHNKRGDEGSREMLKYIEETCVEKGGNLVVPAFSVGRTQAILFTLHQLYREGLLPNIKVFTDSPLAIRSTTVYANNLQYLNQEAHAFFKAHGSLFDFPLLHVVEEEYESELISSLPEPCIIISAAGMVEGGRIQMHVRNNIGSDRNTILIAGFCAEGTLGWRLLQGQDFVEINRKPRPVRSRIARTDAFSAHPDHEGLKKYIHESVDHGIKGIFLVHGDAKQQDLLAADLPGLPVHIPQKGQFFELS